MPVFTAEGREEVNEVREQFNPAGEHNNSAFSRSETLEIGLTELKRSTSESKSIINRVRNRN